MTQPLIHRLLLCAFAIAAASAIGAFYLCVDRDSAHVASLQAGAASPPSIDSAIYTAAGHGDSAAKVGADVRPVQRRAQSRVAVGSAPLPGVQDNAAGHPIVNALPPSMLELARTTSWDAEASAALERFMTSMFDADGDGMLSDLERITAVRALRDAVWAPEPNEAAETLRDDRDNPTPLAETAMLSAHDRRLHHDVDEARRRDQQNGAGIDEINADLRAEIVRRFQTNDDGRLAVDEFARYMACRNTGSASADLNGDGRIDDADLRLFLDVASPLDRVR